mmetsp:Transcript_135431/g.191633  ORF Transcript_135431/g.191633 Transcript_135431/m.191633 type:complete len:83 (-) Transcript_135431:181-429(-)|eukprot:s3709_g3.t1
MGWAAAHLPLRASLVLLVSQGAFAFDDDNPACWLNWEVNITEDGVSRTSDACTEYLLVTILNVALFFGAFWFVIKAMVQQTQ